MTLLLLFFCLPFSVWLILALFGSSRCNPTVGGFIISMMLGCLSWYLLFCYFGFMGKERDKE